MGAGELIENFDFLVQTDFEVFQILFVANQILIDLFQIITKQCKLLKDSF
jgi:hypothetical protein